MVLDKDTALDTAQVSDLPLGPDPIFAAFLDLPMTLRAELGRRSYRCADVIALSVGSVLSVNRSAGENVTLLLNGRHIGSGEIVVIEDSMGLRITQIGEPAPGREK